MRPPAVLSPARASYIMTTHLSLTSSPSASSALSVLSTPSNFAVRGVFRVESIIVSGRGPGEVDDSALVSVKGLVSEDDGLGSIEGLESSEGWVSIEGFVSIFGLRSGEGAVVGDAPAGEFALDEPTGFRSRSARLSNVHKRASKSVIPFGREGGGHEDSPSALTLFSPSSLSPPSRFRFLLSIASFHNLTISFASDPIG